MRRAAQQVSPNVIFEHPTIKQLAHAVSSLLDPSAHAQGVSSSRADAIRALIAKYTADMPTAKAKGKANASPPVVLLTGSTGNIGSHILAYLLADERVGRVYTLNRPSADPLGRLKAAFTERGLPAEMLDDARLVSLAGDITKENFGLEEAQYREVRLAMSFCGMAD